MCEYCDPESKDCCIFREPETHELYLDLKVYEWDQYDEDFVPYREFISYCPYCGRKLEE